MAPRVLIPLPDRDFDVTEVAVPWYVLTRAGVEVVFATEHGAEPAADPLLLKRLPPGLKARADAVAHYRALEQSAAFARPQRWSELCATDYDGLWLAGGHAPGMRQYLSSELLSAFVADYWTLARPVAAICHGVLVLARSRAEGSDHSLLHGRRTTCLPKYMEQSAYFMTGWILGRYYRTYPAYVEDEVQAALAAPADFLRGPRTLVRRGRDGDDRGTFVVEDGNYVSARWPGDSYALARAFLARLVPLAASGGPRAQISAA
jgi:putative intracellular protease/amidase